MESKRKGRENVGLLNGAGDLMTKEMEKDKMPSSPQLCLASPAFRILRPGGRLQPGSFSLRKGVSGSGTKLDIQIQECRESWLMSF